MPTTSAAPSADDTLDRRRWAALAVLLIGAFLGPLDFFIVNVAMPSITAGLGARPAQIQLVISAYAVVYAVFLITGGRLGDLFGRKIIFLAGLAGFAVASALCGLAWSPDALIVARMLQGLAAAAMAPQALASIHALFPPHERGRAISLYAVTIGSASAIGQLLGGALVGADLGGYGWRLVFLINLPVVIIAFLAAVPLLRETRAATRPRLDWGGVALSSLGLAALILPLVEGREQGWPLWSILSLLAAPVFLGLFLRHEIRLAEAGGDPLVAIDAFRTPGLLRGLGAILMIYAMATFFLTYAIYLQSGLGLSAWQSGLAILPFTAGFLAASTFSPALGRLFGAATPSMGFLVSAAGAVATASTASAMPNWTLLGGAVMLIGLGMGLSMPTMMRVVVERVAPHRAGLVGGLVNTALQVSGALSVAVLGGLFFSLLGTRSDPGAVSHAFAVALLAIALCQLGGAVLAAGLGQRRVPARLPMRLAREG
jgi:EmrB/QacA subfamily drug resistance transporter